MSRVRSSRVLRLETRHPTDSHWWGTLTLDPAGKTAVHVLVTGTTFGSTKQDASLPFVELDELQEIIDLAREQCASMGFAD